MLSMRYTPGQRDGVGAGHEGSGAPGRLAQQRRTDQGGVALSRRCPDRGRVDHHDCRGASRSRGGSDHAEPMGRLRDRPARLRCRRRRVRSGAGSCSVSVSVPSIATSALAPGAARPRSHRGPGSITRRTWRGHPARGRRPFRHEIRTRRRGARTRRAPRRQLPHGRNGPLAPRRSRPHSGPALGAERAIASPTSARTSRRKTQHEAQRAAEPGQRGQRPGPSVDACGWTVDISASLVGRVPRSQLGGVHPHIKSVLSWLRSLCRALLSSRP
jgi:hypothetical protein